MDKNPLHFFQRGLKEPDLIQWTEMDLVSHSEDSIWRRDLIESLLKQIIRLKLCKPLMNILTQKHHKYRCICKTTWFETRSLPYAITTALLHYNTQGCILRDANWKSALISLKLLKILFSQPKKKFNSSCLLYFRNIWNSGQFVLCFWELFSHWEIIMAPMCVGISIIFVKIHIPLLVKTIAFLHLFFWLFSW